jgi:hypothetical protein
MSPDPAVPASVAEPTVPPWPIPPALVEPPAPAVPETPPWEAVFIVSDAEESVSEDEETVSKEASLVLEVPDESHPRVKVEIERARAKARMLKRYLEGMAISFLLESWTREN